MKKKKVYDTIKQITQNNIYHVKFSNRINATNNNLTQNEGRGKNATGAAGISPCHYVELKPIGFY